MRVKLWQGRRTRLEDDGEGAEVRMGGKELRAGAGEETGAEGLTVSGLKSLPVSLF